MDLADIDGLLAASQIAWHRKETNCSKRGPVFSCARVPSPPRRRWSRDTGRGCRIEQLADSATSFRFLRISL
jgi:hypothetical protein